MALTLNRSFSFREKLSIFLPPLFFAALFFLCSADVFFTTRIAGFNFRWGQLLLFPLAITAFWRWIQNSEKQVFPDVSPIRLSLLWVPFFSVYGLAAVLSPTPHASFLKLGWAFFNIGCALWICLGSRWNGALENGFLWAAGLLSGIILFQAVAVYWFDLIPGAHSGPGTRPLNLPGFAFFPIGYMQYGLQYLGKDFYRPNAFYYEPSYAGAALSFVLPLVMVLKSNRPGWKAVLLPAFVGTAVFFCSSRTGTLAEAVTLGFAGVFALLQRNKNAFSQIMKTILVMATIVIVFSIAPGGRNYVAYLVVGPMSAQGTIENTKDPTLSETHRLQNLKDCLDLLAQHPLLGNGVAQTGDGKGLSQVSMNTWLEIGIESGILGLLAFLWAVLGTMGAALGRNWKTTAALLVAGAWFAHFTVRYNFSQTFPRLDYWFLFFLSVRFLLLRRPEPVGKVPAKKPS